MAIRARSCFFVFKKKKHVTVGYKELQRVISCSEAHRSRIGCALTGTKVSERGTKRMEAALSGYLRG